MATYDFDGMFGDKYSTEQAINNAMYNEALSFGQLDRSKYAPMTASTFGQEYMAGAGMAGLLGGQHPMMKRQNLLDEIQKKFPDPRTPKELNELAEELTKNGFGDLAMQVRQVAMEMQKNETTASAAKLAAQTPSDSAFSNLQKSLSNKLVTKEMVHGYMQHGKWDDAEGTKYGAWGSDFTMQDTDRESAWHTQYLYDYEQAEKELKGEIENFSIDFQAQGSTKSILNQLILNPDMQVSEFEKFVGIKGNTSAGKFLADQTFVISSVKADRLKEVNDDSASVSMDALSGATALPASSLTNTNQTIAMNDKTWLDDIEENFNFIPSGIVT